MNSIPGIPSQIAIIDIGPYLNNQGDTRQIAQGLRKVLSKTGCFYVKNHGMPKKIQNDILKNMESFFRSPKEEKNKIHMDKNDKSGFGYFGYNEQLKGKVDFKEGIYVGLPQQSNDLKIFQKFPLHGNNLLPQGPEEYIQSINQYMKNMVRIGHLIMEAIAQSLNLNKNYFRNGIFKQISCYMSMTHNKRDEQNPDFVSHKQHHDYGFLAILMSSGKGLQVRDLEGNWIHFDPIEDTLVVIIGDVIQKMTKSLYRSAPHRVIKPLVPDRYSIPFFYEPCWDSKIEEINFIYSQQEGAIMQNTRQKKRIDNIKVKDIKGKYGKYFIQKMSCVFPVLQKYLHFYQEKQFKDEPI